MALYNLSNVTGALNGASQVQAINLLSNGLFGTLLLLSALATIFTIFRLRSDIDDLPLIAYVLWLGVILSTMLRIIDLVPEQVVIVMVIMAISAIAALWATRR